MFHNTVEYYDFLNYALDINNIDLVKYIINNRTPVKKIIDKGYIEIDYDWQKKEEEAIIRLYNFNKDLYNLFVKSCVNKYVIRFFKYMMDDIDMIKPFFDCDYNNEIEVCEKCYEEIKPTDKYSYNEHKCERGYIKKSSTYKKLFMSEMFNLITMSAKIYKYDYEESQVAKTNIKDYNKNRFDNIYSILLMIDNDEWIEFLNEAALYDAYTEANETRATHLLKELSYKLDTSKHNCFADNPQNKDGCIHHKCNEYLCKRLFDGTYKIANYYEDGLAKVSKMKMEHCIKYYKPESCMKLQKIFYWYCYTNSKYIYKVVQLSIQQGIMLKMPTLDTLYGCYSSVHYCDNDEDERPDEMKILYNRIKNKMFNLGAPISKYLL